MAAMAGAAVLLKGGAALCCLSFIAFLWYMGTDSYQELSAQSIDTDLAFGTLSGQTVLLLILTWGTLLLATLLTLLLRRFATKPGPKPAGSTLHQVRRLLSWQLPPRPFWADWCGGLSLAEAIGVLGWLGLNALWLGVGLHNVFGTGVADWQTQLNMTAKLFGQAIAPNLMLLFLPIPHTNVISWLTGVSRNRLIRFHRWLGHGTLWVVTIHSVLYYIYWGVTNTFWENFKAWSDVGSVNNLAGSLAFFLVLILWVSSLTFVRRHFYEFFYRCHIICFVGFFLLSCAHYSGCWMYFAPGLILYAADLALRAGQMSNITTVTAATVDEDAGMATITLSADKSLQHRPLTEIWLLLPILSRWQWHPFSVASGGGSTLKLHIKKYGRFTKALLSVLRQGRPLAVRLSGPMGNEVSAGFQLTPPPSWGQYEVIVMICGGVGVTAMLSMLRSMAAQRAQQGSQPGAGLPRRVICVWTARHMAEFLALDAQLLLAATSQSGWLTLSLHLTGGSQAPALSSPGVRASISHTNAPLKPRGSPAGTDCSSHASSSTRSLSTSPSKHYAPAAAAAPTRIAGSSAYFWNLLRPAQPMTFGAFHLAAVFVLTFFGAFCAALLGADYLERSDQWKGGMVTCVLLSFLATGLPFMLAIFPVHFFRYLRAANAVGSGDKAQAAAAAEEHMAVPYSEQAALEDQSSIVEGLSVSLPGTGVSLGASPGRPDVAAALYAAAEEAGAGTVGVYAGGPAGLMKSVHLTVCRLNSERRSEEPYFELHNESVEL